jgi:hypothetical protein
MCAKILDPYSWPVHLRWILNKAEDDAASAQIARIDTVKPQKQKMRTAFEDRTFLSRPGVTVLSEELPLSFGEQRAQQ